MCGRIGYRVGQFLRAMLGRVRKKEYVWLESYLSPSQVALFRQMRRIDQRHGLDVFRTLYDAGHREAALLQAALLHDLGKSAGRLTIFHRVAVVLLDRFAPAWLERLAQDGRGWRSGFAVHARHAEVGARWMAQAGCSPEVVALVAQHHRSNSHDALLAALRLADGQN